MKCLAARPDLGAKKETWQSIQYLWPIFVQKVYHHVSTLNCFQLLRANNPATKGDKEEMQKLKCCISMTKTLTYSPIAAMWHCYLDVCLHNGFIHRANGIIICTV